jgi:hypothetical protein
MANFWLSGERLMHLCPEFSQSHFVLNFVPETWPPDYGQLPTWMNSATAKRKLSGQGLVNPLQNSLPGT